MEIPDDVWKAAEAARKAKPHSDLAALAYAILVERERWKPAVHYFARYCQDEADSAENCTCGGAQHEDAKAFEAAIRRGSS